MCWLVPTPSLIAVGYLGTARTPHLSPLQRSKSSQRCSLRSYVVQACASLQWLQHISRVAPHAEDRCFFFRRHFTASAEVEISQDLRQCWNSTPAKTQAACFKAMHEDETHLDKKIISGLVVRWEPNESPGILLFRPNLVNSKTQSIDWTNSNTALTFDLLTTVANFQNGFNQLTNARLFSKFTQQTIEAWLLRLSPSTLKDENLWMFTDGCLLKKSAND